MPTAAVWTMSKWIGLTRSGGRSETLPDQYHRCRVLRAPFPNTMSARRRRAGKAIARFRAASIPPRQHCIAVYAHEVLDIVATAQKKTTAAVSTALSLGRCADLRPGQVAVIEPRR